MVKVMVAAKADLLAKHLDPQMHCELLRALPLSATMTGCSTRTAVIGIVLISCAQLRAAERHKRHMFEERAAKGYMYLIASLHTGLWLERSDSRANREDNHEWRASDADRSACWRGMASDNGPKVGLLAPVPWWRHHATDESDREMRLCPVCVN